MTDTFGTYVNYGCCSRAIRRNCASHQPLVPSRTLTSKLSLTYYILHLPGSVSRHGATHAWQMPENNSSKTHLSREHVILMARVVQVHYTG